VKGFSGAKYKKCSSEEDAWSFVNAGAPKAVEIQKKKPLPTQLTQKKPGPPRKSILIGALPKQSVSGFGNQNSGECIIVH
jgi:hypothetical protein